jgi:hypothetical protein
MVPRATYILIFLAKLKNNNLNFQKSVKKILDIANDVLTVSIKSQPKVLNILGYTMTTNSSKFHSFLLV